MSENRLASLDTYRGFVMLLMLAEVLRWEDVAKAVPHSAFLELMAFHQSHVEWVGCSLHDMIQPSFSFLVGVVLPFSLASRVAKGQSRSQQLRHALLRALILSLLGIFLRSLEKPQTYFTFEDTLTQIGLGYGFLFVIGWLPWRWQWVAFGALVLGYWAAFALTPLPPPNYDWPAVGVPADWSYHLSGFAAHWEKNANLAFYFDRWFLNLFPREKPFVFNGGGYATLSFIPTLATMVLGLLAGGVLRSERPAVAKVRWLIGAGLIALASGWLANTLGICPVVKRIWTPSWVLYSGGWCLLFLAGFYQTVDVWGKAKWFFPLQVIGLNSIAAYCLSWLAAEQVEKALYRHFGHAPFALFGTAFTLTLHGISTLLVLWLILYWMYRRQLFLRI